MAQYGQSLAQTKKLRRPMTTKTNLKSNEKIQMQDSSKNEVDVKRNLLSENGEMQNLDVQSLKDTFTEKNSTIMSPHGSQQRQVVIPQEYRQPRVAKTADGINSNPRNNPSGNNLVKAPYGQRPPM